MESEKFICFITGASGVGKSTLANQMEKRYAERDDISIHGFDSIGVPSIEEMEELHGSGTEWRRHTTNEWIRRLIHDVEEPIVFLEGQVNLDFIIDAFTHHAFENFRIVFIDCDEDEMMRRLIEERNQPELATEDMKNWRQHLRSQADEFEVHVINTATINEEDLIHVFETFVHDIL